MADLEPPTRVLLTCVHYHNSAEVARFAWHLSRLQAPEGLQLSLAVADNSASWPNELPLPSNVRIWKPEGNRGYLPGCAFALRQWQAVNPDAPDWVGVANTDLTLHPRCLLALFGRRAPDSVGILAPNIRLPDGSPQNPFMRTRPSPRKVLAYTYLFRSLALTSTLQWLHEVKRRVRRLRRSAPPRRPMPDARAQETIYAPHGSLFFLSERYFRQGASLDYKGFMYGEELFVAEQTRRAGLETVLVPSALVEHAANSATSFVARRRRLRWMQEGARLAWENDFCRA